MKVSSVRFALSAALPLGALRFECASLWVELCPGLFGNGRNLNGSLGIL